MKQQQPTPAYRYLLYTLAAAILCLLPACSDDEPYPGPDQPGTQPTEGILVTLTAGGLQTKTQLNSSANLHHVNKVYAALYKLNDETQAGKHDADGTYILCKDIEWSPRDSVDQYGPDRAQADTFKLSDEASAKNLKPGTYRVLCFGLDDDSDAKDGNDNADPQGSAYTYGLPNAIQNKSLKDAVATLAAGKGKKDLSRAELFAGWTDFEYTPGDLSTVKIEMKRRVAGVLTYVTDIPKTLNVSGSADGITDGTYDITKIRLRLHKSQHTSIPLCRVENPTDPKQLDFGSGELTTTDGSDASILWEVDLPKFVNDHKPKATTLSEEDGQPQRYEFQQPGCLKNSLLQGVYLLPIEAPETSKTTLVLELLGKLKDQTTNVDPGSPDYKPEEDTRPEQLVRVLPTVYQIPEGNTTGQEATDSKYAEKKDYPILPNYIYSIGRKPNYDTSDDADLSEDYPESLLGTRLKISPCPWFKVDDVDMEFPNTPLEATIDVLITVEDFQQEYPNHLDRGSYDSQYATSYQTIEINPEMYVFDAPAAFAHVRVSASLLRLKWKLSVKDDCDWIYIQTKPGDVDKDGKPLSKFGGEWGKEYISDGLQWDNSVTDENPDDNSERVKGAFIPIVILDYVKDGGADKRTATLTIQTEGKEPIDLTITQYNAIILDVKNKDGESLGKRGFCHYDLDAYRGSKGTVKDFNPPYSYQNSTNNGYGVKMGWGYSSTHSISSIFGPGSTESWASKDGGANTLAAKAFYAVTNKYIFYNCAMYRAYKPMITIESAKIKIYEDSGHCWYLPARWELNTFLNNEKRVNLVPNEYYWTSTVALHYTYERAYGGMLGKPVEDGTGKDSPLRRGKYHYIRQACNIPTTN